MNMPRRSAIAVILGATTALAAAPVWADVTGPVITVSLWDSGGDAMDGLDTANMGMNMAGAADMSMAKMGVKVDVDTVKTGEITFDVTNDSKDTIHEMIVLPIPDPKADLPYDAASMRIDEDAANSIGEVSELEPGAKGRATLRLAPGTYMLVCNIPGHYVLGMWTLITVTE
jgi:uncharacterized cupredoxin-like copper-binding protein